MSQHGFSSINRKGRPYFMSKELPYFKFFPTEYLLGNITLQDYRAQGVFINICALYWQKECRLTKATLEQRFSDATSDLKFLFDAGILKEKGGNIIIDFLNEQWKELNFRHIRAVENGKKGGLKGGLSKATATLKHLDKNKIREYINSCLSLEERVWRDEGLFMKHKIIPSRFAELLECFDLHLKTQQQPINDLRHFKNSLILWLNNGHGKEFIKKERSNL